MIVVATPLQTTGESCLSGEKAGGGQNEEARPPLPPWHWP